MFELFQENHYSSHWIMFLLFEFDVSFHLIFPTLYQGELGFASLSWVLSRKKHGSNARLCHDCNYSYHGIIVFTGRSTSDSCFFLSHFKAQDKPRSKVLIKDLKSRPKQGEGWKDMSGLLQDKHYSCHGIMSLRRELKMCLSIVLSLHHQGGLTRLLDCFWEEEARIKCPSLPWLQLFLTWNGCAQWQVRSSDSCFFLAFQGGKQTKKQKPFLLDQDLKYYSPLDWNEW